MSVYSPIYHAMVMSPSPALSPAPGDAVTVTATKPAASDGEHKDFFHHLLDVVNPLQHLPVIGTLYRAITGEHIGAIEKIAGDALYGGLWGAVSSVADVAFEGITGKSFEDTALSWIKGDDQIQVASRKVQAPVITSANMPLSASLPDLLSQGSTVASVASAAPGGADIAALSNALSAKGMDNDMASRALYAYRRSMGVTAQPVLASVN